MDKRSILIAIAAGLAGFIAGFMFANSVNRNAMMTAAPTTGLPQTSQPAQSVDPARDLLTPDEIKARIAQADQIPKDFSFQKNLGISLYRYASLKQDPSILPESIRIMQRALDLDPADRDLVVALGNAHFDVGYFNKDNAAFVRSREFYNKALARIPSDTDVRADLALTYFLQEPPDLTIAVAEFERGLAANPKHERALQFLTQTYVKRGELGKATETLNRLRSANPSNTGIPELEAMIASGEVTSK